MGDDLGILLFTVGTALLSTALIFPLALAAALALARSKGLLAELCETALALPLVLPPTAVGLLLLELLSADGPLGALELVFTWKGVVLASAVMSFPLLVRSARTAFQEVDPKLIGVARTLGHGRAAAFFKVTLPLAWRGVAVGALLAFARALGEFGATILVAGNIPGRTQTLALAIFHRAQLGQDRAALRLIGLTTLLAFAAIFVTERLSQRRAGKLAGRPLD